METEERYYRMLNRLRAGAATGGCGAWLARTDALGRLALHSQLLFERLEYKLNTVKEIYDRAGCNWNMTFFVMFFRTLGDASNREAFMRLAWKVTCNAVLHERASITAVESLLLGTSGLLDLYPQDDYVLSLRAEYAHLAHKYSVEAMSAEEWNLHRINPLNHPVLRLAQAAAFFTQNEFVCREALECRTADDVATLFGAEASDYWLTHFTPGNEGGEVPKRIGRTKASLMGINLVAPLQFAYGRFTADEPMRERSMDLLESIDAEDNRYMRRWAAYGVVPANAFDSQALLQLATSYCDRQRCEECPLGRRILTESQQAESPDEGKAESIGLRSW